MTSLSNNPVGRLYELLDAFQKSSNQGQTLDNVIRRVFWINIDEKNPNHRRAIYLEIRDLIKASKVEILKLPATSRTLNLKPIINVEKAFTNQGLFSTWEAFSKYLDSETMTGLRFIAENLSYLGEKAVPKEYIENLKREAYEALVLVSNTSMDFKLQVFLLEQLEEIYYKAQYSWFRGNGGLKEALERMIGGGIIFTEENRNIYTPDEVRSKVESVMQALVHVVSCANGLQVLPHTNIAFLLNLP